MARRIRIETPGFHHIYNRGVEKRFVYSEKSDKEKFLQILCEVSEHYDFIVHAYVLMDNHYHLLIENKKENLSAGMRQINSLYAQYFNKKYDRVGHLWQDRYKSWTVLDESYLFTLFKYFENNPVKAGLAERVGEYEWALMHDISFGKVKRCMLKSFVLTWYDDTEKFLDNLGIGLSDNEMASLDLIKKESARIKRISKSKHHPFDLESFFRNIDCKKERNKKIFEAYTMGATQSDIAKQLDMDVSTVSRIIKKLK